MKATWILGLLFLTAAITNASDSLMTVRNCAVRTCQILNIDTTGTGKFDSTLLNQFATDGAMRAYTDLGVAKSKKIAISGGISSYLVDAGLLWVRGALFDTNYAFAGLMEIDPDSFSNKQYWSNLQGTLTRPTYYIRHGDSIMIIPRPPDNDSLYIFYFAREAFPYADTVSIQISSEQRMAAIYATAIFIELRRRNFEAVGMFEQFYQQEIGRLREKFEISGVRQ